MLFAYTSTELNYTQVVIPTFIFAWFSYAPIGVAYKRHVIKRNLVAWLCCLWIIPFALLIASVIAMFGKTE